MVESSPSANDPLVDLKAAAPGLRWRIVRPQAKVKLQRFTGGRMMPFARVLSSEQELRELMGEPIAQAVVDKSLLALDRQCRLFISRAPFLLISSSDADGCSDISP